MYADVVNTVSKNYSKEIQKPEFGEGLDRLLTEVRAKLSGILNGIDFEDLNPATDKLIAANYDLYSLEKRKKNKLALQEEFDLERNPSIPLFGYVGRIDDQKGLDILMEVIPPILRDFSAQFVFVGGVAGGGNTGLAHRIKELQKEYPDKIGPHLLIDFELSHLVFAGVDIMLIPSRFEPCGLVPMEAMRYGSIPLVHGVGGMVDSVEPYNPDTDEGFGFVFKNYDPYSLFAQIIRALEIYRNKSDWEKLIKRVMKEDNSWDKRAHEYISLYEKAIQKTRRRLDQKGKSL
jgi:starch synthase